MSLMILLNPLGVYLAQLLHFQNIGSFYIACAIFCRSQTKQTLTTFTPYIPQKKNTFYINIKQTNGTFNLCTQYHHHYFHAKNVKEKTLRLMLQQHLIIQSFLPYNIHFSTP